MATVRKADGDRGQSGGWPDRRSPFSVCVMHSQAVGHCDAGDITFRLRALPCLLLLWARPIPLDAATSLARMLGFCLAIRFHIQSSGRFAAAWPTVASNGPGVWGRKGARSWA